MSKTSLMKKTIRQPKKSSMVTTGLQAEKNGFPCTQQCVGYLRKLQINTYIFDFLNKVYKSLRVPTAHRFRKLEL